MPVSSISAIFSQSSASVAIENRSTRFAILSPASGCLVPWHSKQYFWNVLGGVAATTLRRDEGVSTRGGDPGSHPTARTTRGGDPGSADITDATATARAMHNPRRFMALQVLRSELGFTQCPIAYRIVLIPKAYPSTENS